MKLRITAVFMAIATVSAIAAAIAMAWIKVVSALITNVLTGHYLMDLPYEWVFNIVSMFAPSGVMGILYLNYIVKVSGLKEANENIYS